MTPPRDLGLLTGVSLSVLVRASRQKHSEEQRGPAHSTGSLPGNPLPDPQDALSVSIP